MKRFAALLDSLSLQPSRNGKLRLLKAYLGDAPDPDRGFAVAALTGGLSLANAKPALLRGLAVERVGETLFSLSYDYVGDLAETVALLWMPRAEATDASDDGLGTIIAKLETASRSDLPQLLVNLLDRFGTNERWALLKLITGALRVGVSARLAKSAIAEFAAERGGAVTLEDIEEVWHSLEPPYEALFHWAEGRGPRPDPNASAAFRPFMLSTPLDEKDLDALDPKSYRAEWKWDGIRVQLVRAGDHRRLYSRGGEDIGRSFPDILEKMQFDGVLDGELLIARPGREGLDISSFNELQQRLNRKGVTGKVMEQYPAHVRLYDLLFEAGEDLRPLPFDVRRGRLEAWYARHQGPGFDLSPMIAFSDWAELAALRASARAAAIEGLMLKRGDSPYVSGRPKGPWFKWKRDALTIDAVLMYAQRGHGKRSSFYSDYTFGCWLAPDAKGKSGLVPVGKAYSGYTDDELLKLDRWVRAHTTNRFGPVRELEPALVVEVAFDAVQRSTRHKSGLALRFPRFSRIRWDKPAPEADTVETLEALLEA